ncbi:BlaI/MecI/CopY family transcriptional regulator [Qipengyuania sp. GH38]|uniref:CopY family transcriptional repressor n=1 Tax=Qipengyuania aquimaris TaxID=255984 RepID=A0A6I4TKK7_9SPHN|nr:MULTISPECIES: BlaI/MecI/CopY family transcriptional regulator [Qipengyuania]MBX7515414.1 BlaI/MecI/CopY family transcriptional regulator [Qipengyuania intermedia]MCA0904596.1 BlaI/MecI/CopY family transcriptional regulator [Qipengyuania aquimaris]MXO95551.1 CopY family transcriptional repressor [Qipengyuania aquimaris]
MGQRKQSPGDRISEAEHAVMEALWTESPLSAAEVCERVCAENDWSIPTVKTLLGRLVAKRVIGTEPQGRKFLYHPLIERSDYVGGESRRLVDRLFGGRAAPLFAHLAENEALTDSDLEEIEALLKEMRK